MAYSISLTKRTNGGYTIVTEDYTCYPSVLTYHGIDGGVILFSRGLNLLRFYRPSEWTIQSATGYTTVVQVCDALDALGISATEGTDDIEALLTTIDADTGSILTAVQLMDDDLDDARIALQIIDDWDESDRAKVNLIASQAGIDGNSGAVTAKTPRVTLASDDPAVVSLGNIDNAVDGNYLNVNANIAGTDIVGGAGAVAAGVQRVTLASDDPAVVAVQLIDNFISGSRGLVTEDNSADIKTAVNTIMGQDFLCITDTAAHATLDCTMIYIMTDAVFTDITVGGSNVVSGKGLSAKTVTAGTMLPFSKAHATAITLASGTVIAYIN